MAARNTRQNPPVTDDTRAKIAAAGRARHRQRRAVLADRLRALGKLSDREAARVAGASDETVRSVRFEYKLPRPPAGGRRGEASGRRAELRRAELAGRLESLGACTAGEAAAALACSKSLILRIRRERPQLPRPVQVREAGGWRTDRGQVGR
jgi:hypothetical protein